MAETDSINHLTHKGLLIIVMALLGISFSLGDGQTWSFSRSAFAEEIVPSNDTSFEQTKPCSLWLSGTPRPATSTFSKPLGDTNANNKGPADALREYLAQVQARIRQSWSIIPINLPNRALTTIINFRLERAGRVSNVTIQQSSGNEYTDLAARQALQRAVPLPPFPPYIADRYLDAAYTFFVEELKKTSDQPRSGLIRGHALAGTELIVTDQSASEESWTSQRYQYGDCRKHLETLTQVIDEVADSQAGLSRLQHIANDLPFSENNTESFENSDIVSLVESLRYRIKARSEEIKVKLVTDSEMERFDNVCKPEILKSGFPDRLRDEPVASSRPETKTLGRAFCTAINGGGKVEFHVIDEKTPTVGIFVTTKKRRFVVVLQKKMQGDLSEEWTAIEIQTPSDRKPIINMLGYSFMDMRFPALVRNE
ncbi:MAG TPA: energy transducer TonB [Nitrospira sp.]|nr:energy transducer TonB [Nitrospira sp.]